MNAVMDSIVVGNKATLALECMINQPERLEGRVFLYVNGERYGQDDFDEDLLGFLDRQLAFEINERIDYPELFQLSTQEIYDFMHCMSGAQADENCNKFNVSGYDPAKLDWDIMIRAGYAFDRLFIALVANQEKEKLTVFNETGHGGNSVVTRKGRFYALLRKLYQELNKR